MIKVEQTAQDASLVILSDVWLDQPMVLQKLRTLFTGFSQAVTPIAFVFIGNFKSVPYIYNGENSRAYRDSFDQLAQLISEFPLLAQQSRFIFVPGPHDPWEGSLLPKHSVSKVFTQRMQSKVKHLHFAGNPCRIRYCTQEIVIFREDLMSMMRRNTLIPALSTQEMPLERHLVSTILDQAHLVPLPIEVKPVYWQYEHALHLYPQPDLVLFIDVVDIGRSPRTLSAFL